MMEVYKCLDDVITKVERKEEIILKARHTHGQLAIIDLHKFKYNSRLEGADVFKMLFGISEHNPFGKFEIQKDDDGYITLLRDLRISQQDWILFNIFINTGTVPYYDAYLVDGKFSRVVVSNLSSLQETCSKLGGIPSFDLFYDNFFSCKVKEVVEQNKTEPLTPDQDKQGKYQWAACRSNCQIDIDNFINRINLDEGWSLASIDLTGTVAVHHYYRNWEDNEEN